MYHENKYFYFPMTFRQAYSFLMIFVKLFINIYIFGKTGKL